MSGWYTFTLINSVLVVDDDGPAAASTKPRPPRRRGGLGLPGLAERVEALGGTLTAGPREPSGWRVVADLPLSSGGG
jgi:signal transduction histidine kinase